jgi:ABC-2 type transport system ATP-binding protein
MLARRRKADSLNPAISTESLTKRFPRTVGYRDLFHLRKKRWVMAVQNVSLAVNEGEFFGLLGPNGAGKTTLIKLLCSLVLPTSGQARVFGHDVVREERTVKKLVGLVSSEERSFFWRLTGRENLEFYAALYHIDGRPARERIDFLLDLLELGQQADMRFQSYSTGMRQKLAIARGLLSEPRVLFVDEPTRSLDPVSAQAVRAFLKEKVIGENKTVVLATHNLTEADQLCDRLAIMDHGKVIAHGSVKELRALFQTHEECQIEVRQFPPTALSRLEGIDGVLSCTLSENGAENPMLKLKIANRSQVMPKLMRIIMDSGAEICNCQLKGLPLEEIFTYALNRGEGERN